MRPQVTCAPSGRRVRPRQAAGLAATLLGLSMAAHAAAQPMPAGLTPDRSMKGVSLYEHWDGDGDISQCQGKDTAYGEIVTPYGGWSRPIRIDTDNRSGGCRLALAVVDVHHRLRNWRLSTVFEATGDGGQCGRVGVHDIQIAPHKSKVDRSKWIRMDTDDRSGGCRLTFRLEGSGPSLLVYFQGDDQGKEQCGNRGLQVVSPGTSRSILIDTDRRDGGCLLQFGLR